jgi:putative ABC transport system permease protein
MIVAQIAVSIGVLGAATMLHRGWIGAYGERDPGFRTDDIVSTQLVVLGPRPDSSVPLARLRTEIEAAIRSLPGVVDVGATTRLPWTDAPIRRVSVERSSGGGEQATLSVPTVAVGPGLLELIDATPLVGRLFADPDFRQGAPPVALVNQPFVDESLDGANAVGRRIRFDRPGEEDSPVWYEIVGVVPDRGLSAADPQRAGGVYIPMGDEADFRLLVRYTGRPAEFIPALQATVFAVDPGIAVTGTGVLSRQLLEIRRVYLVFGSIFTSLGSIVLLLSMMATFAILSFEVTRRTREIGLRVALGAHHRSILRLVLGRVVVYMAAGGAIGIVLGYLLLNAARAMLVMRFPPTGLPTFPILIGVMTLAALIAAWLPASRTLSIRPMEALRFD